METGGVLSQYAETSGRRQRTGPTPTEPQQAFAPLREPGVSVITAPMEIAGSSRRVRTITSTRAEMAMSTARTQAEIGKNMRMVAGQTRGQSRLLTPRMGPQREVRGLPSNPPGTRPTGPAQHNCLQPLQVRFSSSIETRKLANEEPSVPNSSSGMKAVVFPEAREERRAVGISKRATRQFNVIQL